MLFVNSKIRLKKIIPGYECTPIKEGDIFTITNIDKSIITFKSDKNYGIGMMNYKEFKEYFEYVPEKQKEQWSEWENIKTFCKEILDISRYTVYFRYKGRISKVQIEDNLTDDYVTAISKCSPYDKYDRDLGMRIAFARALTKLFLTETQKGGKRD
jgi:hypothetical protein